jgi:uncharacterized protein with gpF-like domain
MADPIEVYEDRAYDALQLRLRRYEREVQLVLRDALDDIRKEMSKVYEKSKTDVLTRAEMSKYNRLVTLEKQLTAIIAPAIRKTAAIVAGRVPKELYQEAFFRYAWAIDQASGVRIGWGTLNPDVIMENLANPFSKIAIQKYKQVSPGIQTALNKGLAQGKSYQRMIADIKALVNGKNYEIMRILRTEGQTAINAGQNDAYTRAEERGIEAVRVWDATLDSRTRLAHGQADGQQKHDDDGSLTVDGATTGYYIVGGEKTPYPAWEGMSAGNRVNCRCRERMQIAGYSPQLRRTREKGIIPYQSYQTYAKQYHPEWLERKK